jgi:hypothetical protein
VATGHVEYGLLGSLTQGVTDVHPLAGDVDGRCWGTRRHEAVSVFVWRRVGAEGSSHRLTKMKTEKIVFSSRNFARPS